jgi:hypothetical protein
MVANRRPCPSCGASRVVPIVYGEPTPTAVRAGRTRAPHDLGMRDTQGPPAMGLPRLQPPMGAARRRRGGRLASHDRRRCKAWISYQEGFPRHHRRIDLRPFDRGRSEGSTRYESPAQGSRAFRED